LSSDGGITRGSCVRDASPYPSYVLDILIGRCEEGPLVANGCET
jgi:hypothetical protein